MAYVSVGSEVVASKGWLPGFFGAYFEGKQAAEEAMVAEFGESACIIKPSFIYGGDDFGLLPPRVSGWYGSFIEELLSQAAFVKGAEVLPGLLGVALRPPVNVDAVAAACAARRSSTAPPPSTPSQRSRQRAGSPTPSKPSRANCRMSRSGWAAAARRPFRVVTSLSPPPKVRRSLRRAR